MPDRLIRCVECGKEFVFTTGEQAFFRKKAFKTLTDVKVVVFAVNKVQF